MSKDGEYLIAHTFVAEFNANKTSEESFSDIETATFGQVGYRFTFTKGFNMGIAYTPILLMGNEIDYTHLGALRFGFIF